MHCVKHNLYDVLCFYSTMDYLTIFRHLLLLCISVWKNQYFIHLQIIIIILPIYLSLLGKYRCHKIPLVLQFVLLKILFCTALYTHQCRQQQEQLKVYNNSLCGDIRNMLIQYEMYISISHGCYRFTLMQINSV